MSCLARSCRDNLDAMIDWHCHILPDVDDGASDLDISLAMGVALAAAGFTEIYCTPHLMKGCYEVGSSQVRQAVADLQERFDATGIAIKLHAGREYCLDEYLMDYLADPLTLGNSRSILVEIPPRISADMVRQFAYTLARGGFVPVIAHPERCHLLEPAVRKSDSGGFLGSLKRLAGRGRREHDFAESAGNSLLDYLRDLGCSFQGNLGSFNGFYGRHVKAVAEALRSRGIYDRYGSDLHSPEQAEHVLGAPRSG